MKKYLHVLFLSTTALFIGFLAGCGTPQDTNENVLAPPLSEDNLHDRELIFLMPSDPVSIDPMAANHIGTAQVARQIFDGLFMFDDEGNVVPNLVETYEMQDDGSWVFTLRQGIYFHDGSYFTSEAVRLTIERLIDTERAWPTTFILNMVESVEEIDTYTVRFVTYFPFAPLPAHLTHSATYPMSPEMLRQEADGNFEVGENPIGTGPFRFVSRDYGSSITMERNPYHWRNIPYVDTLTFLVVPEPTVRFNMIYAGEAHATFAEPTDIQFVEDNEDISLIWVDPHQMNYIGFNTSIAPWDNYLLRRAVAYAINRENILYAAQEGLGVLGVAPIPPNVVGAPENVIHSGIDLDYSRSLLEQAGFPDGLTADLHITGGNVWQTIAAPYVQSSLAEIGIDLNIVVHEFGGFAQHIQAGTHTGLFLATWSTVSQDADYALFPLFHRDNQFRATRFYDERLEELLVQARQTTDLATRSVLYEEIVEGLVFYSPMVVLFYPSMALLTTGTEGTVIRVGTSPYFHSTRFIR